MLFRDLLTFKWLFSDSFGLQEKSMRMETICLQFLLTFSTENILEWICCKEQQKKFLTSYRFVEQGPLKILNGKKFILDDQGNHLDSYKISLESFRSFIGPLFRKSVTGQDLFFLFLTANRLYLGGGGGAQIICLHSIWMVP